MVFKTSQRIQILMKPVCHSLYQHWAALGDAQLSGHLCGIVNSKDIIAIHPDA